MGIPVKSRVGNRREALRAAGLRPIQIWVLDSRRPGFAAECHRQAAMVTDADARDPGLITLLDGVLSDSGTETKTTD